MTEEGERNSHFVKKEGKSMKELRSPSETLIGEERKLWGIMLYYDDKYFSDMRLDTMEIIRRFGRIEQLDDKGIRRKYLDESPIMKDNPLYVDKWSIKLVSRLKDGALGRCEKKNKVIKIVKGRNKSELKLTLLHELIHVYESLYNEFFYLKIYEQWLCIYLYERLIKRLGAKVIKELLDYDLNFFIVRDSSFSSFHSLLFLFKSLDLDLKLKKPLGSVYCYGREELFKGIQDNVSKKRK